MVSGGGVCGGNPSRKSHTARHSPNSCGNQGTQDTSSTSAGTRCTEARLISSLAAWEVRPECPHSPTCVLPCGAFFLFFADKPFCDPVICSCHTFHLAIKSPRASFMHITLGDHTFLYDKISHDPHGIRTPDEKNATKTKIGSPPPNSGPAREGRSHSSSRSPQGKNN